MLKYRIFQQKFVDFLNYFLFKLKNFHQLYHLRNKIPINQILNKYYINYKNIVLPFKENLPLIKYDKNPILREGEPGEWDEYGIGEPYILYDGKIYFLYYESKTNVKKNNWQIGVATANNITGPWKKHPSNPILRYTSNKGDNDMQCVADPCVLYHNGKYQMWFDMFDGKTWRIGKTYSDDGIHWDKVKKGDNTTIILDIGKKKDWDDKLVHCPEVFLWNNKFHMLYGAIGTGHLEYDTGLAIQTDKKGERFKKWGQVTNDGMIGHNLLISRMQAGFILKGVFITGLRVKKKNQKETTFMIFSDDGGKTWNKLSGTILKEGTKNDWDSRLYYGPNCWIISENKLWTAYLGGKRADPKRRLGLAYIDTPNIN